MPPTAVATDVAPGTYEYDPVHSSVTFTVRHFGAGKFRGAFGDFDANVQVAEDGSLTIEGAVKVDSVQVKEPRLDVHLKSPDFFDAERYPEIAFKSTSVKVELTHTADDGYGGERIGVELTTTIDRNDFGVTWNAELPGGTLAVANEVTLQVELELKKS